MKKQTKKWLGLFPALLLAVVGIAMFPKGTAVATAEKISAAANPAFERQAAVQRLKEKQFTVNDAEIKMKDKEEETGGVKISGQAENLKNAVFQYGTFDFGGDKADYLIVDALAERKKKMQLAFYLDDAAEPFTTVTLAKQKKKEIWSTVKNRCVSLKDAGITGSHKLSFRVILAEGEIDKLSMVFRSVTFTRSTIPTLDFSIDESLGSIDAMLADSKHDTECYGNMTMWIPEGYQSEYSEEKFETQTYELDYIRGRGNSTWYADKKPYKVKLDQKQDLLGMGANKHWILLANYYDITMLRNKITYWLGAELGMEFTPQCVFVDVVMNGEYMGSYYLCEQIRVGKSRVDIDDLEENADIMQSIDPAIISGGYLLGMSPYGDESKISFSTDQGNQFLIESPSFEDYKNEAQVEYIKNYMQQTEDAIYGTDFKDENGKSYADYMDVASAIDYYWIQEFSMNGDAFGSTSTYLYKKRNGKLYWGPLWDFDYVAWGATEYYGNQVDGFSQNRSTWFERLMQDPEFCRQVKERWPAIKKKLLEAAEDGGQIDRYSAQQYESQKHNYEIWDAYSENGWWGYDWYDGDGDTESGNDEISYDSEVERFKSWIQERVAWIDENLEDIQGKYYSVKFLVDDEEYATLYAKEYDTLEGFPEEPKKEGYSFAGWYAVMEEYGESYESEITANTLIYTDITAKAKWVKGDLERSEVSQLGFITDDYYVMLDEDFNLTCCTLPFNAKDAKISWESDDEDVVRIFPDGNLYSMGVGVATVTARTTNGVSASCKVHVLDWREFEYENLRHAKAVYTAKTETVEKGSYKKLPFEFTPKNGVYYGGILFASSDESVVKVNECGYISGEKAGTAVVIIYNAYDDSGIECCTVTVTDPNQKEPGTTEKPTPAPETPQKTALKKGDKFTYHGLQYQVKSVKNGKCELNCIGVKNKKSKKVTIPNAITYQKQKCTVTGISQKCFSKCKKLKKVYVRNTKLKKQAKKVLKKNAKKVKVYMAK